MWQIINICLGVLVMSLGIFAFPRIVLNKPVAISRKKFLRFLILTWIIYVILYLQTTGTTKTIVITIVTLLSYKYTYKITGNKALLLTFIYIVILMLTEFLELLFLTNVIGLSREFCYNTYAGSLISNSLVCILFVIITFSIRKILRKIINENVENNVKIIILLILTFVCIGMFFHTTIKEFRFSNNIFLYLAAMTILVIVLFVLIIQTIKNNKLTQEYDNLLTFMTTYEKEIENQKTLRHETKNTFLAIKSKIQDKQENSEIVKYIDEILKEKIEVKQEMYAKFGYLPANGIKGLCYFKVQEAENKGIKVALNVSKKVEDSTVYKLDIRQEKEFGKILGVYLDNAIEASLESEEKKLGIEAYANKEKEFKIIISNTYKNKPDKNKLGKESFSTKGKGRGHGLLLVKHIVEKNEIFEIKTEIQEKIYIQTIKIKKNTK